MNNTLKNRYNKLLSKKETIERDLERKEKSLEITEKEYQNNIIARSLITELLENSQDKLKERIDNLVNNVLSDIFERPYSFHLEFMQSRNKIECVPIITENNKIYDNIEEDMGGGILPIISFPLRIIFKTLKNNSRDLIILDEPIKGSLSGIYLEKTIQMYKELAEKLRIQLIFITHFNKLSDVCDAVFHVEHDGKKSSITVTP